MKKIFSALTTLVILVVLFGCTSNLSNDKIDVVDFNILNKEEVVIKDSSFNMNLKLVPENANNYNVIYTSSDNSIVSVSDKGLVTALDKGSAKVTVKIDDLIKVFSFEVFKTYSSPTVISLIGFMK